MSNLAITQKFSLPKPLKTVLLNVNKICVTLCSTPKPPRDCHGLFELPLMTEFVITEFCGSSIHSSPIFPKNPIFPCFWLLHVITRLFSSSQVQVCVSILELMARHGSIRNLSEMRLKEHCKNQSVLCANPLRENQVNLKRKKCFVNNEILFVY